MSRKEELRYAYRVMFKSINWWESELHNLLDFFQNYGSVNTPVFKRLRKQNYDNYNFLLKRGGFEMDTLEKIEADIEKYNKNEKKKKEK